MNGSHSFVQRVVTYLQAIVSIRQYPGLPAGLYFCPAYIASASSWQSAAYAPFPRLRPSPCCRSAFPQTRSPALETPVDLTRIG